MNLSTSNSDTRHHTFAACDLCCERDDRTLFSQLNFKLHPGETLLLQGRNGSGKTTLLRQLCGLRLPDDGRVMWDDTDINTLGTDFYRHMGYVGHRNGTKQDLTALENLALAQAFYGANGHSLDAALEKVGLYGYEDSLTRTLSAGQQRRLALARLLVMGTRLWILDEPFTSLDVHSIETIEGLFESHTAAGGMLEVTSHHAINMNESAVQRIDLS